MRGSPQRSPYGAGGVVDGAALGVATAGRQRPLGRERNPEPDDHPHIPAPPGGCAEPVEVGRRRGGSAAIDGAEALFARGRRRRALGLLPVSGRRERGKAHG
jgi:hypothetical protein